MDSLPARPSAMLERRLAPGATYAGQFTGMSVTLLTALRLWFIESTDSTRRKPNEVKIGSMWP